MPNAFTWLSRIRPSVPRLRAAPLLNRSGHAGPRRLVIIGGSAVGFVGVIVLVSLSGQYAPVVSRDAQMAPVDPLPGGLNTTPEQDALARVANDDEARKAMRKGVSYTPPIAPSVPAVPPPPRAEEADPLPAAGRRVPQRPAGTPEVVRAVVPAPFAALTLPAASAAPKPIPVAAVVDPRGNEAYTQQINGLFSQWGARLPQTDVILPPPEAGSTDPADTRASRAGNGARDAASALPVSARPADTGQILVPAGRGVFAHPILALSSDQSSPVVLQADSGPIAGDRMIGSFARQENRLVLHVNTVIHNGEAIGVDGVVTSPDTMEAGVASGVDQHYLERFILPAAAAFVAGLGQALATTSNTAAVLSPFGGATTTTHLNIDQQLGVAAGVAASQVANTLNQAAPKGPTISLDANVAVGVMFLANVTAHTGR